ncbi:MAG: hypothetical protein ACE14P_05015 [Methanotrichaceae archaeon]
MAKQAAGNQILDFSPDVEALKPAKVVGPKGNICMHYAVCFRLTGLNSFLKEHPGMCYYQNFAAADANVYPISSDQIEKLQVVRDWQKLLDVDSADKA